MKSPMLSDARKLWSKIQIEHLSEDLDHQITLQRKLLDFLHVGPFYYYVFDVKRGKFNYVSPEIEQVLGYTAQEMSIERYFSLVHPDDRPTLLAFEEAVIGFFQNLAAEKITKYKFSYDMRVQKSDGTYIRLLQQAMTISHSAGDDTLLTLGIHTDISHLKSCGTPTLSFIGLDGEPSFYNVTVKQPYVATPEIFTRREKEIIRLIMTGAESAEIGRQLFISKYTVDTHRKNILLKTGTKSAVELVVKVMSEGML